MGRTDLEQVSVGATNPAVLLSISADGRYAAYLDHGIGSGFHRLVLEDLQTGTSQAVATARADHSLASGFGISRDGRFVAFTQTEQDGIHADRVVDVYLWDRVSGAAQLVSTTNAPPQQHRGVNPAISTDGRFVRKASLANPNPLDGLAKLYGLTASEIRVLDAVIKVSGVKAIAEMLGISQATVKSHLHHLFRKSGSRRQSDLVKLVAGIVR